MGLEYRLDRHARQVVEQQHVALQVFHVQRAVMRDAVDDRPRRRGVAVCSLRFNRVDISFDNLYPHCPAGDLLRRQNRPRQGIAVIVVALGDAVDYLIEHAQGIVLAEIGPVDGVKRPFVVGRDAFEHDVFEEEHGMAGVWRRLGRNRRQRGHLRRSLRLRFGRWLDVFENAPGSALPGSTEPGGAARVR